MGNGTSTLSLDDSFREEGTLTSVELAAGAASGGFLVGRGSTRLLLLFADEDLAVGDEVTVPPRRRFTVASVRHGRMNGQAVTAAEVRLSARP